MPPEFYKIRIVLLPSHFPTIPLLFLFSSFLLPSSPFFLPYPSKRWRQATKEMVQGLPSCDREATAAAVWDWGSQGRRPERKGRGARRCRHRVFSQAALTVVGETPDLHRRWEERRERVVAAVHRCGGSPLCSQFKVDNLGEASKLVRDGADEFVV